ncbi:MAG: hypothetical protein FJY85_20795, partial [Deltaproteobacteria bacterium]|nr:hypothetical protein [Deltaproteobacteria bacterium]
SVFSILSLLITAFLTWLFAKLAVYLPAWLVARTEKDHALLDEKLKKDVHDAAVTIARKITLEHADPRVAISEGVEYMMNSAKDATARWMEQGRPLKEIRVIYGKILESKFPQIMNDLNVARFNAASLAQQSAPPPSTQNHEG